MMLGGYNTSMSDIKKYSAKSCAKTLNSVSLDMQALLMRTQDYAMQAVVGDDADLQRETGVELAKELNSQAERQISKGDMTPMIQMLNAQAFALNKVFMKMISINSERLHQEKHYVELAFKAQNQCRRTLATMADIAAPRQTTFVKQQNNGHNVQVNNEVAPDEDMGVPEPIREVQKKKA